MSDGPEWFAPKRYGYGSGLPITWQGWVLFVGFVVITIASAFFLAPRSPLTFMALMLTLSAIFILITKSTTKGGWRWRWGEED